MQTFNSAQIVKRRFGIATLLLIQTVSSAFNFVFIRLMSASMHNYSYFVSIIPLFANVICFAPMVLVQKRRGHITTFTTSKTTKQLIAAMALFDQLADILIIFGAAYTRSFLVPLFTQMVIPVTMLMSKQFLKAKYFAHHWLGAIVVLGGVFLSVFTSHLHPQSENRLINNLLLIGSTIPASASAIIKEYSFRHIEDMDIFYLNFWECLFQIIFAIFFIPLMLVIPPYVSFPDIPLHFYNGLMCLGGINSLEHDHCEGAYKYVVSFIFWDIIFNIAILLVVKYCSASLMFAANTASIPVADIFFTIPFLVGAFAAKFDVWDLAALCLIIAGLILYRIGPQSYALSEEEDVSSDEDDEEAKIANSDFIENESTDPLGVQAVAVERSISLKSDQDHRKRYLSRLGFFGPVKHSLSPLKIPQKPRYKNAGHSILAFQHSRQRRIRRRRKTPNKRIKSPSPLSKGSTIAEKTPLLSSNQPPIVALDNNSRPISLLSSQMFSFVNQKTTSSSSSNISSPRPTRKSVGSRRTSNSLLSNIIKTT